MNSNNAYFVEKESQIRNKYTDKALKQVKFPWRQDFKRAKCYRRIAQTRE
jgi:hypothetical protein